MSLSPRASVLVKKAYGNDPGTLEEFFESSFREKALHKAMSEMPELADRIVALKILRLDVENDSAVGTFILDHSLGEVHIPVVLIGNELAPLDVMYVTYLDKFLPLSEEWLVELEKEQSTQMGKAVPVPEHRPSDKDIRNIVVPPTTGRYAYASKGTKLLPAYVAEASNTVKQSFLRTMERHPKIAHYVLNNYDLEDIKNAVRPHRKKTASSKPSNVLFVTIETPVTETKELFGDKTSIAIKDIAQKGYAVKDNRVTSNRLIPRETPVNLVTPGETGFYRVFLADGSCPEAVVFAKTSTFYGAKYKKTPGAASTRSGNNIRTGLVDETPVRMIYTSDGRFIICDCDFLAQPLGPDEVSDSFKSLISSGRSSRQRSGQRGFYFGPDTTCLTATEPVKIELVTLKKGVRYITGTSSSGDRVQLIQIKDHPLKGIRFVGGRGSRNSSGRMEFSFGENDNDTFRPGDHTISALVPWNFSFIPITEEVDAGLLLRNREAITEVFFRALEESGAVEIRIKNAGSNQYYLGNEVLDQLGALKKLANVYNVNIPDAEYAVKTAGYSRQDSTFYVVAPWVEKSFTDRIKIAFQTDPAMQDPAMQDPAMQDPAMYEQGMQDPAMQEPPPPSPVEIAAQEIAEQVWRANQEVMNQLYMQQQGLDTQLGAIQAVLERAQQIEMEQMGYDAGPPIGAPPVHSPPPPVEHGEDPSLAEGGEYMGEGDPYYGEDDYPAGSAIEEPYAMEEAMQLQDPELFDAAAIASLAEQNKNDSSVTSFVPVFKESLDALGRTLMELRMKSPVLKEELGDKLYEDLLDSSEMLFERLGNMVINISEVSAARPSESL